MKVGSVDSAHPYTVRSRFTRTGLSCTEAVAEQVRQLAAPYLSLELENSSPKSWQVVAGAEPPPHAEAVTVRAQGEVAVEYAVDYPSRFLFHVSPREDAWVVQSLLRATRAIHRSTASRHGAMFMHAGLIHFNGKGIALVGGSRAGKTSLIMASVMNGGCQMVCNDDVSLVYGPDSNEVTGVGWPRSISVRLDSLDLLFGRNRSSTIQASLSHPANQTLLSLRASGIEPHGTALLYPWEYAELFKTEIKQETKVDALVYLSLADDPSGVEFYPVSRSASSKSLEKHILDAPNKHLNIFGHEPRVGVVETTHNAVTDLPSFHLQYYFRDVRTQAEKLVDYLSNQL